MAVNRIIERLESLVIMGEGILGNLHSREGYTGLWADESLFRQWRTSSVSFLKTFPSQYVYHGEYENYCKSNPEDDVKEGIAILRSAKDDIEGGYLQKIENIVSADVFTDFLDMAEYLLEGGYKDPTASLIGAVLEDSLRRICNNNDITLKSREDISSLNQKLAVKGVYNRLQQKQIQVWNDIRNNADHGNFKEYSEDDVKNMLQGVRNFLASQLG